MPSKWLSSVTTVITPQVQTVQRLRRKPRRHREALRTPAWCVVRFTSSCIPVPLFVRNVPSFDKFAATDCSKTFTRFDVTFASSFVLFDFLIFFPTFRFVFTKSTEVLEDVPLVNAFVKPVDSRCLSFLNVGFPAAFAKAFFGLYLGILSV